MCCVPCVSTNLSARIARRRFRVVAAARSLTSNHSATTSHDMTLDAAKLDILIPRALCTYPLGLPAAVCAFVAGVGSLVLQLPDDSTGLSALAIVIPQMPP